SRGSSSSTSGPAPESTTGAAQDPHLAVGLAEEDLVGLVGEEAVLGHPEGGLDGGGQGSQVAGGEPAVEEVVALVGDHRGVVGGAAQGGGGEQVQQAAPRGRPGEPDGLHPKGPGGPPAADQRG